MRGIASLVSAQTWTANHTGSNADSFVGQGWPDFAWARDHARLYRNCSLLLLDGRKVEYINWHSEVNAFPTWGCVVGQDRSGRLSFSVPRPGTVTEWKNLKSQFVIGHDIGIRMWKSRVLREHIPAEVQRLQRQWDTGMTSPELSVCTEPCHICKSSSGTVAFCPLCLMPAHQQCENKLFDVCMQHDAGCMDHHDGCKQGNIIPSRWISPLCGFCKAFNSR